MIPQFREVARGVAGMYKEACEHHADFHRIPKRICVRCLDCEREYDDAFKAMLIALKATLSWNGNIGLLGSAERKRALGLAGAAVELAEKYHPDLPDLPPCPIDGF